jgi:hypothetical protein
LVNMDDPTAQLRADARAGDAVAFGAVFDARLPEVKIIHSKFLAFQSLL